MPVPEWESFSEGNWTLQKSSCGEVKKLALPWPKSSQLIVKATGWKMGGRRYRGIKESQSITRNEAKLEEVIGKKVTNERYQLP